MRNRFSNAVLIQDPGACNPSGVARALVEAIDEARRDDIRPEDDPACRLICHQLAFLLNTAEIDGDIDRYYHLMRECRERASS